MSAGRHTTTIEGGTLHLLKLLQMATKLPREAILKEALGLWQEKHCSKDTLAGIEILCGQAQRENFEALPEADQLIVVENFNKEVV